MTRRPQRGFTLLEALVTLVIVAMIVAALMQALTQALGMRTALIRHQRESRQAVLHEMWFRESASGAVADFADGYGPLLGDADSVDLLTLSPLGGDGLVRATWRLEKSRAGIELRYRDGRVGDIVVLAAPLTRAAFTYLGRDGRWEPRWAPGKDDDAIPRAIRFTASTATRDIDWVVGISARPIPPETLRLRLKEGNAF